MTFFDTLRIRIQHVEVKRFVLYIGIGLGVILLCAGGLVFQYYRSIFALKKRINRVNQYREQAQDILERAQEVVTQRQQVDELLAEDTDFKIGGYFKDILHKLQLTDKKKIETTQNIEREDNYLEIESNPRISTRELEIKRSEKASGTIDVTLVIATLLPLSTSV
jgi:hypothetical protein